MAKFFGVVGYSYIDHDDAIDAPGVSSEKQKEIAYCGDILKNNKKWEASQNLNDNLNINNQISIIADPFAFDHFFAIRYVNWGGVNWKVSNVDVQPPRLILTLGGVYNGKSDWASRYSC